MFGALASVVRLICGFSALVLVTYVLCAVGQANPNNWLVSIVGGIAFHINLGLNGLFPIANPDIRVILDFGIPALAWMSFGGVAGGLLRKMGGQG